MSVEFTTRPTVKLNFHTCSPLSAVTTHAACQCNNEACQKRHGMPADEDCSLEAAAGLASSAEVYPATTEAATAESLLCLSMHVAISEE